MPKKIPVILGQSQRRSYGGALAHIIPIGPVRNLLDARRRRVHATGTQSA